MLSQHPHIEKRLREEVFDKVGPTNRPTYDNMREMKYLRAFLNGNDCCLMQRIHADFISICRGA